MKNQTGREESKHFEEPKTERNLNIMYMNKSNFEIQYAVYA